MKGILAKYGLNRKMTATTANTAVPGVLLGTPVVPALAADSLIFSNRVASGDIVLAGNRAGNSEAGVWVDSSARETRIYGGGVLGIIVGASSVTLSAAMTPTSNDGAALGSATLGWSDLFLATGGVINWNNGEVTLTETSADLLTLAGGDLMIANGQGVVVGHTAQVAILGATPELQVLGTGDADSGLVLLRSSADATGPVLYFGKARDAIGTFTTAITTGDDLGSIVAIGADTADLNANANAAAMIRFDSTGTIAADRIPGTITFHTATDAAPSVLTLALTLSAAQLATFAGGIQGNTRIDVGITGTTTGIVAIDGATSGTVSVTAAAAAGTWTMTLPTGVAGTGGFQLTDANGDGVCTWAAASLGAWKNDLGILDPHEALKAVVSAPTHIFTYRPELMPAGVWAPPDLMTGIFSEEAPWAMHGENGIAFSQINSFGYARAAIQALNEEIQDLKTELAALRN